jgi:hypothetical protein
MTLLGVRATVQHDAPTHADVFEHVSDDVAAGGGTVTHGTDAQHPDDQSIADSTSTNGMPGHLVSSRNDPRLAVEKRGDGTAWGAVSHRPSPRAGRGTHPEIGDPAGCRGTLIPTSSQPGLTRGERRAHPCSSTAQPHASWLLPPLRAFRGRSSGCLWIASCRAIVSSASRRGHDTAVPAARCLTGQPHSVTGRPAERTSFDHSDQPELTGIRHPLVNRHARSTPPQRCRPATTHRAPAPTQP